MRDTGSATVLSKEKLHVKFFPKQMLDIGLASVYSKDKLRSNDLRFQYSALARQLLCACGRNCCPRVLVPARIGEREDVAKTPGGARRRRRGVRGSIPHIQTHTQNQPENHSAAEEECGAENGTRCHEIGAGLPESGTGCRKSGHVRRKSGHVCEIRTIHEPGPTAERTGGVDQARQSVHAGLGQQAGDRARMDIGNAARAASVRAFEAEGAATAATTAARATTAATTK